MNRSLLSRKTLATAVAPTLLVLSGVTFAATGAEAAPSRPADTVAQLQAKAADIAARLDDLDARASRLDEDYNTAQLEFDRLNQQVADNQAAVDAARAALGGHQAAAQQFAIDAYTSSGDTSDEITSLAAHDGDEVSQRRTYLTILHGDRTQIIEDVTAARADLDEREGQLRSAAAQADAKRSALTQMKTALQSNVGETQQLLDQTKGDLADAVTAEQARRDAEAAAQAEAQVRAAAQQAAAGRRADLARRSASLVRAAGVDTSSSAPSIAAGSTTSGSSPAVSSSPASSPAVSSPASDASVPSDVAPASGDAAAAIAAARSQLGVPYRWGASSPGSGFDCSGLVMYAYGAAGRSLPHSSRSMYSSTRRISADELQPGDLVFGGSPVHHVGLYVGGGMMIHAPHSGDVVRIASIFSTSKPVSFGRL